MDDVQTDETIGYVGVQRLLGAYADAVNRRAFHELEDLFLADCVVELETHRGPAVELRGGAGVGSFVAAAIERFDFFVFVILSSRVELDGDRASGRLYMCEVRHERGLGRRSDAFGLYQDDFERRDGRWRFAHRRYSSLARSAPEAGQGMDVFPFPTLAHEMG
jgi:hypothetical protein